MYMARVIDPDRLDFPIRATDCKKNIGPAYAAAAGLVSGCLVFKDFLRPGNTVKHSGFLCPASGGKK